ncbi:Ig-like domain-containing protein [Acinetobacter schindleri]|uniref:Ig-like domain-containing protein n=2 Tax=Acinetobacter schindleri TaxID=108981 RepID=UPI00209B6EE6|nr:Ig-like domain-containing protein [Acinetobacter schindleri]MCO8066283.1 Ig-like domain-containing protein [Acinetobacter schindleri]
MQVQVIAKENGSNNLIKNYLHKIELTDSSIVLIDVKVEDIEKIEYINNQAVITLKNGEKIIVDNFNVEESSLVFRNEQSELFLFDFETVSYDPLSEIELLLNGSQSSLIDLWPWVAGAVAVGILTADSSVNSKGYRAVINENDKDNNGLSDAKEAALKDLITGALDLNQADYTAESWKAVQDALKEAVGTTPADQAALDKLVADLDAAIKGLKEPTEPVVDENDKDNNGLSDAKEAELKNLITDALDLDKADYTAESWKAVQDALKEAVGTKPADQDALDKLVSELDSAIKGLEDVAEPVVDENDKDGNGLTDEQEVALKDLITNALGKDPSAYTAESWKAVQDALKEAVGTTPADQAALDKLVADLDAAIKGLEDVAEPVVDENDKDGNGLSDEQEAALKDLITNALGKDPSAYTAESWKAVQDALKEAVGTTPADQAALDKLVSELDSAIKGLETPVVPELVISKPVLKVENGILTVHADEEVTLQISVNGNQLQEGKDYFVSQSGDNFTVLFTPSYNNGEKIEVTAVYGDQSEKADAYAEDTTAPELKPINLENGVLIVEGDNTAELTVLVNGEPLTTGVVVEKTDTGFKVAIVPALENGESVAVKLTDAKGNSAVSETVEAPNVHDLNDNNVDDKLDAKLAELLDKAQEEIGKSDVYTDATLKALQDAVADVTAKEINSDADAQAQIDKLNNAINGLKEIDQADKDGNGLTDEQEVALKDLITGALDLNQADYTAESWKAVQDALKEAVGTKPADQAALDKLVSELDSAIKGLETPVVPELVISEPELKIENGILTVHADEEVTLQISVDGKQLQEGKDYFVSKSGDDFTVLFTPSYNNGESIEVTAVYGDQSAKAEIEAEDTTAPELKGIELAENGVVKVTGDTTADLKVLVNNEEYSDLDYLVQYTDTGFAIAFTPPLANGEKIVVVLEDRNGNTSISNSVTAYKANDVDGDGLLDSLEAELEKLIGDATNELANPDHTNSSKAELESVLNEVELATPKSDAELQELIDDLQAALNALKPIDPLDRNEDGIQDSYVTELEELVAKAQDLLEGPFTSDSIEDLASVLQNLEQYPPQSNEDYAQTIAELTDAIDGLEVNPPVVDVANLDNGYLIVHADEAVQLKLTANGKELKEGEDYFVSKQGDDFKVLFTPALNSGEDIEITAVFGDKQATTHATASDTVAPVIDDVIYDQASNKLVVTGEPDATLKITVNGNTLEPNTYQVKENNGTYIVQLPLPAYNNGEKIAVQMFDKAGNGSEIVDQYAQGGSDVPVTKFISDDGRIVSGKVTPNAKVLVEYEGGSEIVVADAQGNFEATLATPLVDGKKVTVTEISAGQIKEVTELTYFDKAVLIDEPEIADDGKSVVVHGEPNAKVVITHEGKVIGTGEILADGTAVIDLSKTLLNGNQITLSYEDAKGNKASNSATYIDALAPELSDVVLVQKAYTFRDDINGLQKLEFSLEGVPSDAVAKSVAIGGIEAAYQPSTGTWVAYLPSSVVLAGRDGDLGNLDVVVKMTDASGLESTKALEFTYGMKSIYPETVFEKDIYAGLNLAVTATKIDTSDEDKFKDVGGGLADIGAGSVLGADIAASSASIKFTIEPNTTWDFDVKLSANGLLGGTGVKILIQEKVYQADGSYNWVDTTIASGSVGGALFIGNSITVPVTQLGSGEYKVTAVPTVGLALGQFLTIQMTNAWKYDWTKGIRVDVDNPINYTGDVFVEIADLKFGQEDLPPNLSDYQVTKVYFNGEWTSVDSDKQLTLIKGQYGNLYISQDGSYEYKPNTDKAENVGSIDNFTIVFNNAHSVADGDQYSEYGYEIAVQIESPQVDLNKDTIAQKQNVSEGKTIVTIDDVNVAKIASKNKEVRDETVTFVKEQQSLVLNDGSSFAGATKGDEYFVKFTVNNLPKQTLPDNTVEPSQNFISLMNKTTAIDREFTVVVARTYMKDGVEKTEYLNLTLDSKNNVINSGVQNATSKDLASSITLSADKLLALTDLLDGNYTVYFVRGSGTATTATIEMTAKGTDVINPIVGKGAPVENTGSKIETTNSSLFDFEIVGTGVQGVFQAAKVSNGALKTDWELLKFNPETNKYDVIQSGSVSSGDPLFITGLDQGKYQVKFKNSATLTDVSVITIHEHEYMVDESVELAVSKGYLLANDKYDSNTNKLTMVNQDGSLTEIQGGLTAGTYSGKVTVVETVIENNVATDVTKVKDVTATKIEGKYGDLYVWSNGYYEYLPSKVTDLTAIGKEDVFTYRLTALNGDYVDTTLTITIGSDSIEQLPENGTDSQLIGRTNYDDVLIGNELNNLIKGMGGNDTLIYKVLADNHTGGNGQDIWTDFALGNSANDEADGIDLSELLVEFDSTKVDQFVNLDFLGGEKNTAVLSVDRDGEGDKYQMTELLTLHIQDSATAKYLENADASNFDLLKILMENNQIIF